MKNRITGRSAFLALLKDEGITHLFGNPGTTELPLMDALAVENELRYVLALQEASVIGMADGYAQASGKLAVCNLHVTPGLGNAMGMLYDAQKAGSPILVTAGQHDQDFNATEPILWADLPPIARPLVKWSAEVHRLADLPRLLHRAAKTALAPPTGPVFLSLPGDILKAEGEIDLLAPTRVAAQLRGDPVAVKQAATILAEAKRPLIVAGDTVARSKAHAELIELAELIGAPVYSELVPSTASFPASHPLFRGAMTRMQGPVRKILGQYDVLFSVGGDLFTLSLPSDIEPMPAGLTLIHLDTDPWELGKNYPPQVAILGDPKTTLPDITDALRKTMSSGARGAARERLDAAKAATLAEREALKAKAREMARQTPVQPLSLLNAIGEMLPKDAVVIDETISSGAGIRSLIRSDDPQSFYGLRGGGIGWGLPAALGVKLALPGRPVLALVGDGSAMYTIQALWTAAHYNIGAKFVICNNHSYRLLKFNLLDYWQQQGLKPQDFPSSFPRFFDLQGPDLDFVGLARAMGVSGIRVTQPSEIAPAIQTMLNHEGPFLVDLVVDGNVPR